MSLLSDLYKSATGGIPIGKTGINFNPLFNTRGFSFQGSKPQTTAGEPVVTPEPKTIAEERVVTPDSTKTSDQPTGSVFSKTKTTAGIPSEYINPETGTFYRAEDFAKKVASSVPRKGTYGGDIPTYAGNTLTQGPKTAEQLAMEAATLNNARNDIATGATDPYKVASQSGIAYSPEELSAIEKAYAGIYDPAINSALEKLNKKQEEDLIKFRTDEDIRQYRATTGAERATERAEEQAGIGLERGADGYVDPYAYVEKAKSSGNIKKFLTNFPPELYLNPKAADLVYSEGSGMDGEKVVPSYLQLEKTKTEREAEVWKQLARPEVQALSDEEKAKVIQDSYGLNPETFGLFPISS